MHWRIGSVTAAPGSTAEFGTFGTGFAVGYNDPVIVAERWTAQSTMLHPGQVQFHTANSTLRVSSTRTTGVAYLDFDLTADIPGPGTAWSGELFTAPTGTHNIQLTRDVMRAGETGTFAPVNDLSYMLFLSAGSLQITDAQGTVTKLTAEIAKELHGHISLLAGSPDGATWMTGANHPSPSYSHAGRDASGVWLACG